jgi:glycosyltransferase involved in cell wall biosynthesis
MRAADGLKIAIDAGQAHAGRTGGVATALMALVQGLARLEDGEETYTVVVESEAQHDWLSAAIGTGGRVGLRRIERREEQGTLGARVKRALGPLLPMARRLQELVNLPRHWPEVPISDGFYETLDCDIVHFTTQRFVVCARPTVYNPHDLQHLHYPQFWSPADIARRETIYRTGCQLAHTVVVGSGWTRDDVIRQYAIHPDKVQVIPEGAPTEQCGEPSPATLARVKAQYRLEDGFALYPAVTWAHKNHVRLLEALAYLRDRRGSRIPLVCTGSQQGAEWSRIERRLGELDLGSQVRFLGFVPQEDLRAIHRMAHFLVMPTLFEASSLPIFEAWSEGVPVASAHVAALPEQVADAALLFEPTSVVAIADAMARMVSDEELRRELRSRGYERLKDYDWDRAARCYRAVYRRVARLPLDEEDRWLLGLGWMREHRHGKGEAL